MATWDGSYPVSEDPNYYVYADQEITGGSGTANWQYYNGNENYEILQGGHEYYVQNSPVYEQNYSTTYYPVNANASVSMLPVASNYQEHHRTNPAENNRLFDNVLYYGRPGQSTDHNPKSYKNKYDPKVKQTRNNGRRNVPRQKNSMQNVEQSIDYAANDTEQSSDRSNRNSSDPSAKDDSGSPVGTQSTSKEFGVRSKSSDNFYDRGRNNRRYDNKSRDKQYEQGQKSGMQRNFYRQESGKNTGKFQGNRYFNGKRYSNQPQENSLEASNRRMEKNTVVNNIHVQGNSDSNTGVKQESPLSNETVEGSSQGTDIGRETSSEQSSVKDGTEQYNRPRKYNSHKFSSQETNFRQTESYSRNNRRYPASTKYESYENNYKDRRYNNSEYNEGKEYSNKEWKAESKDRSKNTIGNSEKAVHNWRSRTETDDKLNLLKKRQMKKIIIDDDSSQRDRLSDQLNRGVLECLVCCENIKQNDYVWSCSNCYHVLHLKCTKKWAKSSQGDDGWRCPACQNANLSIPKEYYCFCGKAKQPEWNRRDVAHSCGEVCGRTLTKNTCIHKCTLLCHPGSCPVCTAMVTKHCGCGRTSQTLQCSAHTILQCDSICDRELNCGEHKCERKCHDGECGRCEKTLEQVCYCGKDRREVTCEKDLSLTYACDNVCDKLLDCGNHNCSKLCHPEDCDPCSLTPEKHATCCCGRTVLTEPRKSCLDPIPTCDNICSKNLKCGQPSNPHKCTAICHQGECPTCDLTTDVKCRCGNMDREIACKDLKSKADDARCEKRCVKKRSCGKHKCNQLCCIDIEHICPLPCSKTLSCGKHKCEQSCHKGRCEPCWRSSFEELYCECGASVIYPPVPCGARRPVCNQPCSRQHDCGHEVLHNCHSEPTCPPCSVLTSRWCHGKHELRKAVPCHLGDISCGLPCGKPLSCGRHKCITTCHSGSCERPGQQCQQPCTTPRELCGHICAAPCHEGACPDTPCKEIVKVTCQCGNRSTSRACADNAKEYQRIASNILASKMADVQQGHTIDLEEVFGQGAKKINQWKTLECNDECKLIERNRRLALGLQIVNPDLSGKLVPKYSEFMKQWAKKDPPFCQMVHEKLTELVKLSKTSKQKSRSYSFDTMNKYKRHFVHESCEHFGCESQAYDREPNRNIVATAVRDKCWLPSYSLLEIVQRENGQRKVPGPTLNSSEGSTSAKKIVSLPVTKAQQSPTLTNLKLTEKEPEIDYFDYQG